MLTPHSSRLSDTRAANWNTAVDQYTRTFNDNARRRVAAMANDDLSRYSAIHNTPTDSPDDILAHILRWGGFRQLLLSGAVEKNQSALFLRLLDGLEPLPHAPPRNLKQPWYDLFEKGEPLPCNARIRGISPRKRDIGKAIYVVEVNECPWECVDASADAVLLMTFNQLYLGGPVPQEQLASVVKAMSGTVVLSLKFGQWPNPFKLSLEKVGPIDSLAEALRNLNTGLHTPFELPGSGPDFPLRWTISRYQ